MNHRELNTTGWQGLNTLGRLLIYPVGDFTERTAKCRQQLACQGESKVLELLAPALEALEQFSLHEHEELYTQTFDLNPVCTLEVGWHLYGEQYERGRFLVRARELLTAVGQDEGGELPDFLPSLLGALPRQGESEAIDLAAYLVPAVRKMCEALTDKDPENPYNTILLAVLQGLETRVPGDAVEKVEDRYRPHLRARKQDLVQLGSFAQGSANGCSANRGPQ